MNIRKAITELTAELEVRGITIDLHELETHGPDCRCRPI